MNKNELYRGGKKDRVAIRKKHQMPYDISVKDKRYLWATSTKGKAHALKIARDRLAEIKAKEAGL